MLPVPDAVAAKLPHLPEGPGVYLWKGRDGSTLYIGKAKRLRSRVRSYFANDQLESVKTSHMVSLIGDLETIVVPSEAHALILEANLIKEYRPRFNIALRDDKSYPYIKVTVQEPFPRVFVTRRLEDEGFDGIISVELEDHRYHRTWESESEGLRRARAHLAQFVR